MSTPIPVILCGKSSQIGNSVIASLKPEYEVIHFILNSSIGAVDIPLLLSGHSPSNQSDNIGTKDYSKAAVAIVTGAGYNDADVSSMQEACANAGVRELPWLRPDTEKPRPPLGPEYGSRMVDRVKTCFAELEQKGKMGVGEVFWY